MHLSPEIRLKEVGKEMTELFRLLTNQVEVLAAMKDDEIFDDTNRAINKLNARYNELIVARQSEYTFWVFGFFRSCGFL